MKTNATYQQRDREGFTLVEIMIVVGIIGLLASIAIPSFTKARTAAHQSACINNLRQIDAAIQLCAFERRWSDTYKIQDSDVQYLEEYVKGNAETVTCPAGGEYRVTLVCSNPTCTIVSHDLPGD